MIRASAFRNARSLRPGAGFAFGAGLLVAAFPDFANDRPPLPMRARVYEY